MNTHQLASLIFLGLLVWQSNVMAQVETITAQELQRLERAINEQKAKGAHQTQPAAENPTPRPAKAVPPVNSDDDELNKARERLNDGQIKNDWSKFSAAWKFRGVEKSVGTINYIENVSVKKFKENGFGKDYCTFLMVIDRDLYLRGEHAGVDTAIFKMDAIEIKKTRREKQKEEKLYFWHSDTTFGFNDYDPKFVSCTRKLNPGFIDRGDGCIKSYSIDANTKDHDKIFSAATNYLIACGLLW